MAVCFDAPKVVAALRQIGSDADWSAEVVSSAIAAARSAPPSVAHQLSRALETASFASSDNPAALESIVLARAAFAAFCAAAAAKGWAADDRALLAAAMTADYADVRNAALAEADAIALKEEGA